MATANVFFSLLALATNIALVAVLAGAAVPRLRVKFLRRAAVAALPLAAAVATVSTLGSLYYSEIVGFRPCLLCWFQRGAMYPLAILLVAAVVTRRRDLWRFGLPLALVGAVLASYHYLIQHVPSLAWEATCSVDVPCTAAEIWQFGFISMAYMAASAFLLIAALLWFGTRVVTSPARKGSSGARAAKAAAAGNRDAATVTTATLAVAAIAAVLFAPAPQQSALEPAPTAAVEISGDTLVPFESSEGDPAVGSTLPEISGDDYDGNPVSITADGRAKIVMVVAHWCPHCQDEVPVVQQWLDDNGEPDGVDLYSISSGADPQAGNYPPQAWLEREGWTVPVIADDEDSRAADALGLTGYPYFVFVESDNTVVARHSGKLGIDGLGAAVEQLQASR